MSRRSSRASLSSAADAEFKLECKAAYLSVFDDIRDEIRTEEDFISVLQQAGRNPSKRTVQKYWTDDVDHLTFDDFVDICRKEQPTSRDDLIKAFKKIDLNGDGFISLDELYKLMTTRGEKLSREEVRAMLDEVDDNGDGKLDYNEFCNMVINTTEECKKVSLRVMEKKERRKAKSSRSSAAPAEMEMGSKDDVGEKGVSGSKVSVREVTGENISSLRPSMREGSRRSSVAGSRQSLKGDRGSLIGSRASLKQEAEMKSLSGSKFSLRDETRRGSVAGSRKSVREHADAEMSPEEEGSRMSPREETAAELLSLKDEARRGSVASSRKSFREDADDEQDSPRGKVRRASVASSRKSFREDADAEKVSQAGEVRRASVASSRKSFRGDVDDDEQVSPRGKVRRESMASYRRSVEEDSDDEAEKASLKNKNRRESLSSSRRWMRAEADADKVPRSTPTLKADAEEGEKEEEASGFRATRRASEGGKNLSASRTSFRSRGGEGVAASRASLSHEKLIRQDKEETPAHLEKSGSQISLKSAKSPQDERVLSSQASLRSASIGGSRQSLLSVDDLPKPNPRSKKRPPVAGKVGRIQEPSNVKEWTHSRLRGCFFIDSDEGEVISHQYRFSLSTDDTVWITIQPVKIGDADVLSDTPVDTALFIFKAGKGKPGSFVACTEQRDGKGKYYLECSLDAGDYYLVPFTTGCRFKPRTNEPPTIAKLVKKKDDQITLTTKFKKSLEDIFDMMDLDGNGLLSREEFNWYNVRTSGEEVADEEWEVVEENVDLEKGEITKRGFLKLNEMEAVDSDGDVEDLWITLTNMGFNKSLIIDEACPFQLDVHTENCDDAELRVCALESQREAVESSICKMAVDRGAETKLKSAREAALYTYLGEARASIVVDNKGYSPARVGVDCSRSKNVISSIGSLETTVTVPDSSQKLVLHLLPDDERQEWSVQCSEK